MTEHETLKEICDKIGYEVIDFDYENYFYDTCGEGDKRKADVREIIFTQEFMGKYIGYTNPNPINNFYGELIKHLDNPVQYLYDLIK